MPPAQFDGHTLHDAEDPLHRLAVAGTSLLGAVQVDDVKALKRMGGKPAGDRWGSSS